MFLSFGISSLLVSIDIIFQYIVGFDLLGFKAEGRRLSGPFGSELIAGSFLQRFWIFSLFSLLLFFNIKNKISFNLATSSLLLVITLGIIFSGNRIPLVLFLMMVFLLFLFQKDFRKIFAILFIFVTIFVTYLFNTSMSYKTTIMNLLVIVQKLLII